MSGPLGSAKGRLHSVFFSDNVRPNAVRHRTSYGHRIKKLVFGASKLIAPIPNLTIIIGIYYPRNIIVAPLRDVSHFVFFPHSFLLTLLTGAMAFGSHLSGRILGQRSHPAFQLQRAT
jgi:hypothetical protein